MLILSRRETHGEDAVTITVPPSSVERTVEVVVVRFDGRQVKLGFKAERDIAIVRNELLEPAA